MQKSHINKGIGVEFYESKMFDVNTSINPFDSNKVMEIAYRKAERLSLATYLVTNLISPEESVRDSIRKYSHELLHTLMSLRESSTKTNEKDFKSVIAILRQTASFLDIAYAADLISRMNLDVLKSAYGDLATFLLRSKKGIATEGVELESEFFEQLPMRLKHSQGQNKDEQVVLKDSIKDTLKDIHKKISLKDTQSQTDKRPQSLHTRKQATNRRIMILDVIAKKSPARIKDIVTDMPEYSEKIIQRELSELVQGGVIKKNGIKRWTTYSIVS